MPALDYVILLILPVIMTLIWCALAVQTKRWHDHGMSGTWCLMTLVPFLGPIVVFVVLGCTRGTYGPHRT